ncbi:hypothetical protein ACRRVB_00920 [Candidatus Cardinium hertigii]|uniref:hypothetical protein n=1 Tax=Candidatus Cardinium hertigii TaxID=247481 RepID=UPI003D7EAA78
MNTKLKLFYTLNLFACSGIFACSGLNMSNMDSDKGKAQSCQGKRRASTSPQSGVLSKKIDPTSSTSSGEGSSQLVDKKGIREKACEALIKEIGKKHKNLPSLDKLKEFLICIDPDDPEFDQYLPLRIITFENPENKDKIIDTVKTMLSDQIQLGGMESMVKGKSKNMKRLLWCIATIDPWDNEEEKEEEEDPSDFHYYEDSDYKDEDGNEYLSYYYVNLLDPNLYVYEGDKDGTIQLIHRGDQTFTIKDFQDSSIKNKLNSK